MRLSGKILKNVYNVNAWQYVSQTFMTEGNPNTLYVQLVDLDQTTAIATERSPSNPEYPIRYISPATSLTSTALFDALDADEKITVNGSQPFPGDRSIIKFDLAADQVPNSGNLQITINEDGVTRTFVIRNAINVSTLNIGSC